jgi:hypothetical protein
MAGGKHKDDVERLSTHFAHEKGGAQPPHAVFSVLFA